MLSIFGWSCTQDEQNEKEFKPIDTPSLTGGESNLYTAGSGDLILSWVEYADDSTDVLLFSRWKNLGWSTPMEIARGSDWFVNWADFPSVVVYPFKPKQLAAFWLQKSSSSTYDYDIRISQSMDGGKSWSESFVLHNDGVNAEHGFVSFLPLDTTILACWLDGRNMTGSHDDQNHEHGGDMTLRSVEFNILGKTSNEIEIDQRVCECCQTDMAMADLGPLIVYRDRSEDEIRNIALSRKVDGEWTLPRDISQDEWKITGCPVNGPAIAANRNKVVFAWYSGKENRIEAAISEDNGKSISKRVTVAQENKIGRIDLKLLKDNSWVISWIEMQEESAQIIVSHYSSDNKKIRDYVVDSIDPSRKSGFPRMAFSDNKLFVSWTDVTASSSKVSTAYLLLN